MTSRRTALKILAGAGATAVTGSARADGPRKAPDDAVGMLYDTTLCIGCKACVVACREANGLEPDTSNSEGGLHDSPIDLNGQTKNIIKLFRDEHGRESYVKRQCMHCIDPACEAACMIGSLQKRAHGIVTWDPNRCIGCRYCQIACPFNVPKFEWASASPKIVKCELCDHLVAEGKEPACCEVCPRDAVIYGKRDELLEEAKKRIRDNPGRYIDRVYGETEGGGTQVLYLSHVPFTELGLPDLSDDAVPNLTRSLQHGIYKGFIAPIALYAAAGAIMWRNRKKESEETP
ncbi:MAG: hydrogenase 2 operon protein HybA [Myxococcota bacterium]